MSLKGKVAIVTGGNSGIGKAIALGRAKAGANITAQANGDRSGTCERFRLSKRDRFRIESYTTCCQAEMLLPAAYC